MDFKEATDALMEAGVTLAEVAEALGVVHGTVRQARLDPSASSYRKPPPGWRPRLADLARERGGRLLGLADKIGAGQRGDPEDEP